MSKVLSKRRWLTRLCVVRLFTPRRESTGFHHQFLINPRAIDDSQCPRASRRPRGSAYRFPAAGTKGCGNDNVLLIQTKEIQAEGVNELIRVLAEGGAIVHEVRMLSLRKYNLFSRLLLRIEAYAIHEPWLRSDPQSDETRCRERLLQGAFLTAAHHARACELQPAFMSGLSRDARRFPRRRCRKAKSDAASRSGIPAFGHRQCRRNSSGSCLLHTDWCVWTGGRCSPD